jgi:hypothetical protein
MQRNLGKGLLKLHLRRTVDHGQQNEEAKLPQSHLYERKGRQTSHLSILSTLHRLFNHCGILEQQ